MNYIKSGGRSAVVDSVFAPTTATATLSAELEAITGIPALSIVTTIAAALHAREARATAGVSDRSAEVIALVNAHPEGIRAADVEAKLGPDARRYLARLAETGRIQRARRGLYTPVPSVPLSQDNVLHLGQRDGWDTDLGGSA